MSGAASFAKRWSWHKRRCRPHHFRFFTSNHSRPQAATINTATTDHGVDEGGSSLGVDGTGAVEGGFGVGRGFVEDDFCS
jgi:hypothetical protein